MEKKTDIVKKETQYVDTMHASKEQELVMEIKLHVDHAQKTLLHAAVEIGERLMRAKEIVKHGEWSAWLENRVQFSRSTANNFMAIYNEYAGSEVSNSQTFGNLNYSQALQLIALPPEKRSQFVEEHNMQDMTVRKLKETIEAMTKEKSDLSSQLDTLAKEKAQLDSDKESAAKEAENLKKSIAKLEEEKRKAESAQDIAVQKKLAEAVKEEQKRLEAAEKKSASLEKKLSALTKLYVGKEDAIRQEEKDKAEKLLIKKEKEVETLSEKFKAQLEKAKSQLQDERTRTKQAKSQATLSKDLVRCELLLFHVQQDVEEITRILSVLKRVNAVQAKEMEQILYDTLVALTGKGTVRKVS